MGFPQYKKGRGSSGHGVVLFGGAVVAESANATNLQITTQPVGSTSPNLATQPVVVAKKSLGTTDSAYVTNVVPTLNVLTGSATLGGSEAAGKACVAGVCTFTNLTVTAAAGATWTITFTSGSLTSATSSTGTTTSGSGWTTVKQFNFRRKADTTSTIGAVTDGANATYVVERAALDGFAEIYPTTRTVGGQSVTFGWTGADAQPRDRLSSVDVRLAGIHFNTANSVATFRVDVPAPGNYKIRLALGDATAGNSEARIVVKDGATTLFSITNLTGTAAGHFLDATNTDYSSAAWPASNSQVTVAVAGTSLTFLIGSASSAVNTYLAHIEVEAA